MITGNRGIATETAQVLSLEGNLDAFITRRLSANSWFNCWRFWLSRFIHRVSRSQRLPFTTPRMRPPLRKNSALHTSSMALLACCRTWNVELIVDDAAVGRPLFNAIGERPLIST